MNDVLDKKIEDVLDSADRMFIATSVGGNSSGASVFYARAVSYTHLTLPTIYSV